MNNKITIAELHKEIDLIQNCINRMAQTSFLIKGWTITIFAVVLGLLPTKVKSPYVFFLVLLCCASQSCFGTWIAFS